MKKFILFISVLLVVFYNEAHAQFAFTRDIEDESGNIRMYNMMLTEADNSIVGTTSPDQLPWGGIYLVKLNFRGGFLWGKNYSIPRPSSFNGLKLLPAENDGFVAIAALQKNFFGGFGSVVFKGDSNGNILWAKRLRPNLEKYTTIALGCAYGFDKSVYTIHLIVDSGLSIQKLNKKGDIVWSRYLKIDTNKNALLHFTFAAATIDDGLIFSTTSGTYVSDTFYNHLYKISKDGKAEWEYTTKKTSNSDIYGFAGQQSDNGNLNILYLHYGNYYYSVLNPETGESHTYNIGKTIFDIQSSLRNNNNQGFFNGVSFPSLGGDHLLTLYAFTKNKSFIETSQYQTGLIKWTIRIQLYDTLGRVCPDFTIPTSKSIRKEIDFKFIKSSYHFSKSPITFSVIDTILSVVDVDSITKICAGKPPLLIGSFEKDFASKTNSNPFKIYPNPAKNQLNILLNANVGYISKMEIITVNGNILLSESKPIKGRNNISLNISGIKAGVYFLKASTNGYTTIQKFVKE